LVGVPTEHPPAQDRIAEPLRPVECMARPVRNHGTKEDSVYDPFLGSGTTLIACEQLGRRCFGLELDPRYVDVIIGRWEKLTGKAATLDGRTFAEVAKERA
jgi:DNA modification methylase